MSSLYRQSLIFSSLCDSAKELFPLMNKQSYIAVSLFHLGLSDLFSSLVAVGMPFRQSSSGDKDLCPRIVLLLTAFPVPTNRELSRSNCF